VKPATFEPVTRRTVSAEIRNRLVSAITERELTPGTMLDSERVLCERFGVARTTIREAIQGLISAGFLEYRGNRLIVVEHLPDITFTGSGLRVDDRKQFVRQLFEVRRVLEPQIAVLAAERATDTDRQAIMILASSRPNTLDEFRTIDRKFHSLISHACGNKLLDEIHAKTLGSLFGSEDFQSLLYAEANRAEVDDIICSASAAHQLIADAIVAKQKKNTNAAVIAHLADVERRMIERLV
jgi:GntR family transcriptional repressor for pyruvate dehydrogenase complex